MYLINLLILLYHYINNIFNNSLEFFLVLWNQLIVINRIQNKSLFT